MLWSNFSKMRYNIICMKITWYADQGDGSAFTFTIHGDIPGVQPSKKTKFNSVQIFRKDDFLVRENDFLVCEFFFCATFSYWDMFDFACMPCVSRPADLLEWKMIEWKNRLKWWTGPTRPGPTVTLFDGLFLRKYER